MKADQRNPIALIALLVSLVPFLSSLSMLALRAGVGPRWLLYVFAQITGVFLMFLIVIGSALAVVALGRSSGKHDPKIYAAFACCALSIVALVVFSNYG